MARCQIDRVPAEDARTSSDPQALRFGPGQCQWSPLPVVVLARRNSAKRTTSARSSSVRDPTTREAANLLILRDIDTEEIVD